MSYKFIILTLLLTTTTFSHGGDYMLTRNYNQSIDLTGIDEIIIQCYCSNRHLTTTKNNTLDLNMKIVESSLGYQGQQKKLHNIKPEKLVFTSSKNGHQLIIESQEIAYTHHSIEIADLDIKLPSSVKLTIIPLTYDALEQRVLSK